MRMRGAASNSVTCDPKALKIEATWTPVAPAPITSSESGADSRRQASLWVLVSSKPGSGSRARRAPGAHDDVGGSQSGSVLALDHVRLGEAGGSGVLMEGHAGALELVAQGRVLADVAGDLADAVEQAPIVERELAGVDAIASELPRLPHQARRVGEGPHRHRPVVGGHSSELVARDQRRPRPESRCAQGRDDARRPGADHDHIEVVRGHACSVACPEGCGMGDTQRSRLRLSVRAEHAEGPLWDAATACLWWVDITAERVHCFDPQSSEDRSWATGGQPGGVVLDATGQPVVASPEGLAVLDRATGKLDLRVPIEQDRPENRGNDIKVDSRGRAWVGTMAFDKRPGNAALYRVEGDRVTRVVDGLTISNGPAFDEPRGRLYLADTALYAIDVFDLDPATGDLDGRRRFLDFRGEQLWPDGKTVDDDGMLWVALGRAGAVHRYRPDGALDGVVEVPTSNPTSVAFGGSDGGDLYITTSWVDSERRADEPLAGAIFVCRPGVTGRPSPRYKELPDQPRKASLRDRAHRPVRSVR